jgi:ribonuclease R
MLPEALSGGLCSLKPGLPRLALVALLRFGLQGEALGEEFFPALIRSRSRLTYVQAQAMLDGASGGAGAALGSMLRAAGELAALRICLRRERGALDFDLPEPLAEVDAGGRILALRRRERLFSHRLIEEFMISVNEAAARRLALSGGGAHFLYRVHPAPEPGKVRELAEMLRRSGLGEGRLPAPGREAEFLRGIPAAARGTAWEFVANRLLLRSQMQARYSPEARGHFGLASEAYVHFTSPIRRYADLTAHRALRRGFGFSDGTPEGRALYALAESLNESERAAVQAERDIFKVCAALFLRERRGESFEAVVSGVSAFGLFVELRDPPVEGFIPLSGLPDDYYTWRPEMQALLGRRNGRIFRLGREHKAVLLEADPLRRELGFALAVERERPGGKGKRRRGGTV